MKRFRCLLYSLALLTAPALSGDLGKAVLNDEAPLAASGWSACSLFKENTFYKGDGFIRSLSHRGRYQGQYVSSSDDYPGGATNEFWEHRRWRAGLDIGMANDLKLASMFNLDTSPNFSGDRFVDSIYEMKLEWAPSKDFRLVLGKQKARITREWATSSASILTFERSTLVNNVISNPLWGGAIEFAAGGLSHEIGVYSVAYDNGFAWPSFEDSGASAIYRVSRRWTEATSLFLDYQYVDTRTGAGFSDTFAASPYGHVAALGTESRWGRFGLTTDLIYGADRRAGNGFDDGDDTWGLVVMPHYDLTDKLQAVAKYTYAEDLRVDRPQRHASRPSVDGYSSLYLGLNYRICGDHLKLMAGYEYASADRVVGTNTEYRNDSWLVGVRTTW